MKKLRITVLLIFTNLLLVLSYNSCSADKDEMTPPPSGNDCENVTAKFSSQIFPLIQTKCALPECHSTASQTGGFHLTNYAEISARASAINNAVQSGIMPKTGSLTNQEKLMIKCWVQSGAKND